jgi:uncharacterized membrane protein
MSLALGVVKFLRADRAIEVLDGYSELHPREAWPNQVGIISRGRLGRISVYRSLGDDWDDEGALTAAGLGLGGLTGALAGALAGPTGLAAGAALGASLGGVVGALDENEKPFYAVLRGKLEKNTSAILLLADEKLVDRMLSELGPDGVETMRRKVSDAVQGDLIAAVHEVARQDAAASAAPLPSTGQATTPNPPPSTLPTTPGR